jgi:hypothetical protein
VIGSRASHVEIDVQGARTASIALALGRIAFGVGLIAAPSRVAGGWLSGDALPARARWGTVALAGAAAGMGAALLAGVDS